MTTRRFVVPLAAALVLALAGCSMGGTTTADPTVSPTATATPEPTRPDLDDLLVSPDGVGPLLIGQPVAEEPAETAIVAWDPTGCGSDGAETVAGEPYAGYWDSTYSDSPDSRDLVLVTTGGVKDGTLAVIIVDSPEPTTAEGIHVGSTRDELLLAYPGIVALADPNLSTVYIVEGDSGTLAFEVATDNPEVPGYWDAGQTDTVLWMRITDTATGPGPIAATDGNGPCPL